MNNTQYYTSRIIVILTLLLGACADSATHFIVAPSISVPTISVANKMADNVTASQGSMPSPTRTEKKLISLAVLDLRIKNHLVEIFQADQATVLIHSQRPIAEAITESLTIPLTLQGIKIAERSTNEVTLSIVESTVTVKQSLTTYTADTAIEMRVIVNNQIETLTKTFKTVGQSNGLLTADMAVLERDFNQTLATLLKQIITDQEMNHSLR